MFENQQGFVPIQIILSILAGTIVLGGVVGGVLYFSKSKLSAEQIKQTTTHPQGKCGDGVCDVAEKANPDMCPKDCDVSQSQTQKTEETTTEQQSTTQTEQPTKPTATTNQQSQQSAGDNSIDADGFLWGTEIYMTILENPNDTSEINAINNTLKVKNVKFRVGVIVDKNGNFSNIVCVPSITNCKISYDVDKFVSIFKQNGWSMIPMFQEPPSTNGVSSDSDINKYVEFIDWFLGRYKNDANIKYIELFNAPALNLVSGKIPVKYTLKQMLTAQNNVYDTVKQKYSDIKVGTHGFEYHFDDSRNPGTSKMIEMVDYFLDKNNGAKFDFWAFHGYSSYNSPVKTAVNNKYAGVPGILEIRKKLDANGWTSRLMIDTEHTPLSGGTSPASDSEDKVDAAYMVQELTIKKTMKNDGKYVLSGIVPLKMIKGGVGGEKEWGTLNSDGLITRSVTATALFISKLNSYNHSAHLSGTFDRSDEVWVEKFTSESNKELYIFFKPLNTGNEILINTLDKTTIDYVLNLSKKPSSIKLTYIDGSTENLTLSQSIILKAINSPKYLEVNY